MENAVSVQIISEKKYKKLYQLEKNIRDLERQFIAIYFRVKSESFDFCSYSCKSLTGFALGNLEAVNICFHCTDTAVSSRYYFQSQIHIIEYFFFFF